MQIVIFKEDDDSSFEDLFALGNEIFAKLNLFEQGYDFEVTE